MMSLSSGAVAPPTCLVIGPIGDERAPLGSPERDRWEKGLRVYRRVIVPACAAHEIEPLRADLISRQGEIPEQVFVALRDRDLVIADLTDANPNVMYELALRHAVGKCVILISEWKRLPFDVQWLRTIPFTIDELGLIEARDKLQTAIATVIETGCDRVTATRILQENVIATGTDATPSSARPPDPATPDSPPPGDEYQELGFLDILAAGEAALPRLNATIVELGVELDQMKTIAERGTAEVEQLSARGENTATARLPIIGRFAEALAKSATRIELLMQRYSADIALIDPAVTFLNDRLEADSALIGEAPGYLPSIVKLRDVTRRSIEVSETLAQTTIELAPISRVLRAPTTRVATALRSMRDVSKPIFAWGDRADAILARSHKPTATRTRDRKRPAQSKPRRTK